MMKCHRFHLIKDGEVILSAKRKGNKMVIGKGTEIHLKKCTINHCAEIIQEKKKNIVQTDDQSFVINYVIFEDSKAISMSTSFMHNETKLLWLPKKPRLNPKTGGYCLKLGGAYHHSVVSSSKNSALQNSEGRTTFITRMLGTNHFEAECNPTISPVIAFSIALSSIVGPSIDYSGED